MAISIRAALIVPGCWEGTSCDTLHDELKGLESLDRRWYRRSTAFYKLVNGQAPLYLSQYLPKKKVFSYNLRKKARLSGSLLFFRLG